MVLTHLLFSSHLGQYLPTSPTTVREIPSVLPQLYAVLSMTNLAGKRLEFFLS